MISPSARSVTVNLVARQAADGDGLTDELGDEQILEMEPDGAGVEPGDLEQVLDQALEPGDVADQQVECSLGPLGHLVATGLHHLDAGGERHQRRPQLVADVAGEPGIAFDAVLQCLGHVVERGREELEVVVVGVLEPGVEPPAGDRLGGLGRVAERADRHAWRRSSRSARRPAW